MKNNSDKLTGKKIIRLSFSRINIRDIYVLYTHMYIGLYMYL